MKTFLITAGRHSVFSGLMAIGLLGSCATTDQLSQSGEYDDMYFTANDRDLVEFTELNEPGKAKYNNKGSYQYKEDNYSRKNVNPDLIAEYQNNDNKQAADESEYYVEEEDRVYGNQPIINNNYYGQSHGAYGAPFYNSPYQDPFYSSAYRGFGRFGRYGYDPFYSSFYRPGFNIGFGLGMTFGSPWGMGMRNPYYGYGGFGRPFGYGGFHDPFNSFYDPFYASAYGYNPYYGGGGYGYWNRPGIIIVNNGEGINGKTPVRTNVPMRVSRANQKVNVADVRGTTPNRVNSTRSSYTRSATDFSSQNAVNKSDARREANRRILSDTNNNSRRSNSYSSERNTRQYTNSTRDSYRSRNYNNNNRSVDFGNNSNSRSNNNSFNTRSSGSSGGSISSPSPSTSRPSGSRGRP